jgi:hypothetical protein
MLPSAPCDCHGIFRPDLNMCTSSAAVFLKTVLCGTELQVFRPINPKAVTRNELYGYLHPQTREWKEGLVKLPI